MHTMPHMEHLIAPPTTVSKPSTAQVEQRIRRIYDHLYANARVRTPKGIAREVGKLLHTAAFIEGKSGNPAFTFSKPEVKQLESGQSLLIADLARHVRSAFIQMNSDWDIYSAEDR